MFLKKKINKAIIPAVMDIEAALKKDIDYAKALADSGEYGKLVEFVFSRKAEFSRYEACFLEDEEYRGFYYEIFFRRQWNSTRQLFALVRNELAGRGLLPDSRVFRIGGSDVSEMANRTSEKIRRLSNTLKLAELIPEAFLSENYPFLLEGIRNMRQVACDAGCHLAQLNFLNSQIERVRRS